MPEWMDPSDNNGELSILRLQAKDGQTFKNPFIIRSSVEICAGGKIDGAFPENRGMYYSLKVRNDDQVRKLLKMDKLTDGTRVEVITHPSLNTVRCVVSCSDVRDIPEAELKNHLKDQKVVDVRKITRRVGETRINTASMILTFNGTTAPGYVEFGFLRARTRPYYPAPMQCYKCWQFGHTKIRCQQEKSICGRCAKAHEQTEDKNCSEVKHCSRCNDSSHAISEKICPHIKENEIQHIRIDQGVSYPNAKRIYEASHTTRTYAGITNTGKDEQINTLMKKLDEITKKMAEKDERIQALEQKLSATHRMGVVQKYGTIEDMVERMNKLEKFAAKKELEVSQLRSKLRTLYPSPVQPSQNPLKTPQHSTTDKDDFIRPRSISPADPRSTLSSIFNPLEQSTPKRPLFDIKQEKRSSKIKKQNANEQPVETQDIPMVDETIDLE